MANKSPEKSNGKHPGGRPTVQTPENAALVCELIANGFLMREVREKTGVSPVVICEWESRDPEFANAIARARIIGTSVMVEEGASIAAEEPRTIVSEDGSERVDSGWVQHVTSRLNYLKWFAGKRDPKRYGDAVANQTVNVGVAVNTISDEELSELREQKRAAVEFRLAQARETKVLTNGSNGHSHGN